MSKLSVEFLSTVHISVGLLGRQPLCRALTVRRPHLSPQLRRLPVENSVGSRSPPPPPPHRAQATTSSSRKFISNFSRCDNPTSVRRTQQQLASRLFPQGCGSFERRRCSSEAGGSAEQAARPPRPSRAAAHPDREHPQHRHPLLQSPRLERCHHADRESVSAWRCHSCILQKVPYMAFMPRQHEVRPTSGAPTHLPNEHGEKPPQREAAAFLKVQRKKDPACSVKETQAQRRRENGSSQNPSSSVLCLF